MCREILVEPLSDIYLVGKNTKNIKISIVVRQLFFQSHACLLSHDMRAPNNNKVTCMLTPTGAGKKWLCCVLWIVVVCCGL